MLENKNVRIMIFEIIMIEITFNIRIIIYVDFIVVLIRLKVIQSKNLMNNYLAIVIKQNNNLGQNIHG